MARFRGQWRIVSLLWAVEYARAIRAGRRPNALDFSFPRTIRRMHRTAERLLRMKLRRLGIDPDSVEELYQTSWRPRPPYRIRVPGVDLKETGSGPESRKGHAPDLDSAGGLDRLMEDD